MIYSLAYSVTTVQSDYATEWCRNCNDTYKRFTYTTQPSHIGKVINLRKWVHQSTALWGYMVLLFIA